MLRDFAPIREVATTGGPEAKEGEGELGDEVKGEQGPAHGRFQTRWARAPTSLASLASRPPVVRDPPADSGTRLCERYDSMA